MSQAIMHGPLKKPVTESARGKLARQLGLSIDAGDIQLMQDAAIEIERLRELANEAPPPSAVGAPTQVVNAEPAKRRGRPPKNRG